jgi:hypothetical protein
MNLTKSGRDYVGVQLPVLRRISFPRSAVLSYSNTCCIYLILKHL